MEHVVIIIVGFVVWVTLGSAPLDNKALEKERAKEVEIFWQK